jgi:hypothetical protein
MRATPALPTPDGSEDGSGCTKKVDIRATPSDPSPRFRLRRWLDYASGVGMDDTTRARAA